MDLLATCLRETEEETGLLLDPGQLLRKMSLEPAGRTYNNPLWVQPFLFEITEPPQLRLQQSEISDAHWLVKGKFENISRHREVEMLQGELFPAFPMKDYYIWGFTYRLLLKICDIPNQQI